jgi:hypothetical protein
VGAVLFDNDADGPKGGRAEWRGRKEENNKEREKSASLLPSLDSNQERERE